MVFAANQRKVKASFTASATHASTRRRRRAKPPRSSPNALLSEEFCNKARPRSCPLEEYAEAYGIREVGYLLRRAKMGFLAANAATPGRQSDIRSLI